MQHGGRAHLHAAGARAMNSAASRQLPMPPMPEMGAPRLRIARDFATMFSAIGLTAEPQ
jgi:hypothetical protein